MSEAVTPDWERTRDAYGYVPRVDENTISDADYLIARLQHIAAEAAEHGARQRHSDNHTHRYGADFIELGMLQHGLERFASELRLFSRAGEEMMTLLRRRFPDMSWHRDRNAFEGFERSDTLTPGEVAPRCARELRLIERPAKGDRPSSGWEGRQEGFPITVHRPAESTSRRVRLDAPLVAWLLATAPGLPPIHWDGAGFIVRDGEYVRVALRGEVYDFAYPDAGAVATQWARTLGLGRASKCGEDGRRSYVAETDIGLVQVEWIADRKRYDAWARRLHEDDGTAS